ncbi:MULTISPECIES: aminoacyl--tRNA ligase-related protein [Bacillus cereus group]|uniref:Aminoacyl-tRNA synthetase class II (G/ P/ S/T) domain-containing protein n=2 Tax=Bacillus cereus group TaxID=86661 RepID=A0AAE9PIC0_BACCE|nr:MULTISPECIES: aminoacyl--tRNA ligase-related protein [Bacillus cereus group]EEM55804.1 tRNA synthetase class II (G H P and S) [Bacillus thuringiensis serovar monterrey BGSC 4AJ1]MEB9673540.1 hypothetical protein [Bacillus anthracis]OTW46526.1 hypothetical protein BK699_19915 [Bacillus thuringiensis serovar mexicanensis]OTX06259.1 hypothetical protein BK705_10870 [Bacillus thuringiensis serovar monterrey]UYW71995.1 hypothetical protein OK229_28590 [Bacillus cereus]
MKINIEREISKRFIKESIINQIKYYFPEVKEIQFKDLFIEVFFNDKVTDDIEKNVKQEVEKIMKKLRMVERLGSQKIIYNSSNTSEKIDVIYEMKALSRKFVKASEELLEFLRKESLKESRNCIVGNNSSIQKGINVYRNTSATMMDGLNLFFKRYFELEFQAQDIKIPSMISSEIVDKAGYFDTACQHLSFVAPLNNSPAKFNNFLSYWESAKARDNYKGLHGFLKEPKDVLNPALCLHCYPLLQDVNIENDDLIALTVFGSCFRDESGNLNNGERLREFSMREGVFLGNDMRLKEVHVQLVNFYIWFGKLFDFKFTIEHAHDIFFNEHADKQLFSQLVSDNKLELVCHDENHNKSYSVASINKHQNHFSSRFNLCDSQEEVLSTMCIGFGFNRIIYALETQLQRPLTELINELEGRLSIMKKNMQDGVLIS